MRGSACVRSSSILPSFKVPKASYPESSNSMRPTLAVVAKANGAARQVKASYLAYWSAMDASTPRSSRMSPPTR